MSRRLKYPATSIYNLIDERDRRGGFNRRSRFNASRWSWRIRTVFKSAPLVLGLLLLASVVALLLRARG